MTGVKAGSRSITSFRCHSDMHEQDQWFWADRKKGPAAMGVVLRSSIRQLILQAYCAFNAFEKQTISIMFICGARFSLFRFTRPKKSPPLPEVSTELGPPSKKQNADDQWAEYRDALTKLTTANATTNSQLSDAIPLNCVEVAYHAVPVFADLRAQHAHLSDGFRQALRECLDGINLQPCSLFDLQAAQFSREDIRSDLVCLLASDTPATFVDPFVQHEATAMLTEWYAGVNVNHSDVFRTPSRKSEKSSPYDETSPIRHPRTGAIIPETESSPEFKYKGRNTEIEPRTSIPRKVKHSSGPPEA